MGLVFVKGGELPRDSQLAGTKLQDFEIAKFEVTWAEWKEAREWSMVKGYDLGDIGSGSGDDHPVRDVNWYDVVKWCNARSEMDGLRPVYKAGGKVYRRGEFGLNGSTEVDASVGANGYRLPSEAEWEWAARGGVKTNEYVYSGSNDLGSVGWFWENSKGASVNLVEGKGTHPVGLKQPNELGLYDMSGTFLSGAGTLTSQLARVGPKTSARVDGCVVEGGIIKRLLLRFPLATIATTILITAQFLGDFVSPATSPDRSRDLRDSRIKEPRQRSSLPDVSKSDFIASLTLPRLGRRITHPRSG